ncbi:OmpA family protein [Cytophaga hutchinsonii]|jgi:outer membrane protein OmpA-like peptidoglycan-associated protein|uniref:Outer membrane peptidoglycan-associated protein n=1 Tax=Cytophaga hutchinsonii (strain ATCC 33406 / DSM 1761 / CIP 103989 / NBRC 15051 / NCIMB 9469 / D465) TaxID=269798 RepID=A0A6N4STY8_CYTH3|nr:OmpA family protein [Cytophaga hutchinsonii]ABG59859.1 outer membrane peptidoglycan-associated protein [Cytophaga hutchinsonii ATCC 33406]SFX28607.1 WD40-like Beta Propeller Repeat [Cytophaga hutchinsonii ATCC 33406]
MKYLAFSIVFILTAFTRVTAQNLDGIDKSLSLSKMKTRARIAEETGDIYTALFYYEEVVRNDSSDLKALYQVAEMQRFTRNYKAAEVTYGKIHEIAAADYPLAQYYQGLMQKMTGRYEDAKQTFSEFRKNSAALADKTFKATLARDISGCDSGITYRDFPQNTQIKNAGKSVNFPHTEFSPVILDSTTLAFGSLRIDSVIYYDTRGEHYEKQPVRQLYEAKKVKGQWVEKGLLEAINDPAMDMGNFVYSPTTDRYYFTKCTKNHHGKVSCAIYYSERVSGKWSHPSKLPDPINIEGYTATQPTIVIDTTSSSAATTTPKNMPPRKTGGNKPVPKPVVNTIEYLYFVSDRPKGKGGLDIWYTSYNASKKTWNEPTNLAVANTPETECTPFYHVPTQTLYFSSNGLVNAGGLDIYKLEKDGRRFGRPENLSFPVNSPQDELSFVLADNAKTGFFVSNRPGGTPFFHETCCDDIFSFEVIPPPPFVCTLDLSVLDVAAKNNCDGELLNINQVNLKTKAAEKDTVRLSSCKYTVSLAQHVKYTFFINKPGYVTDTLSFETRDMCATPTITKSLTLVPVSVSMKNSEPVIETPVEGKAFVLKDIQYETNQTDLNDEAKAAIDNILIPFLKEHPTDKIIISSHTDDVGSHKYNENLSDQRALKVMQYLIQKGISAKQIQAKGYGETKPIASNINPDGSENEIGRSINRRTEFLISK